MEHTEDIPESWWVEFCDDGPIAGRLGRLYDRLRMWQMRNLNGEWMPTVDVDPEDPRYVAFSWSTREASPQA